MRSSFFITIGSIFNIIGCSFNFAYQLVRTIAQVQIPALVITAAVFVSIAAILIIIGLVKFFRE